MNLTKYIDRVETKQLPKPNEVCKIILNNFSGNGLEEMIATWIPYNSANYSGNNQPAKGYLGTFRTDKYGFHVWEQNESQVRYWKPVQ